MPEEGRWLLSADLFASLLIRTQAMWHNTRFEVELLALKRNSYYRASVLMFLGNSSTTHTGKTASSQKPCWGKVGFAVTAKICLNIKKKKRQSNIILSYLFPCLLVKKPWDDEIHRWRREVKSSASKKYPTRSHHQANSSPRPRHSKPDEEKQQMTLHPSELWAWPRNKKHKDIKRFWCKKRKEAWVRDKKK